MKKVKNFFSKTLNKISRYIDDLLLIIGIILLSVGVFKIYIPAGFISLGICIIAFAFLYARREVGDFD